MTARVADGARRRLGLGLLAGALLPGVATRAAAMPGPDVRPDHASPGPRRWRAPLMGTVVTVLVDHPDVARREAALQAAWARMHAQADRLSRFRATSLVSQLAREAGGAPLPVHPEDLPVLQRAVTLARLSGGRFDASVGAYADWDFTPVPGRGSTAGAPRRPDAATLRRQRAFVDPRALEIDAQAGTARLRRAGMRLDLGGVAKLPILLTGLRTLQAHGVGDALIDGGGDVLCSGRCGGRPWRVGLRDPLAPQHLRGALDLPGGGVLVASGDYERGYVQDGRRWHHVLDPRSGMPTQGLHGVLLLGEGPDAVAAVERLNGWGAAVMVAGAAGAARWLGPGGPLQGVPALLAGPDGHHWVHGLGARVSAA